jgi:alkanesulfonate monooxygenase SsuD/methylene tetrahydromethanopterin reductase-like flavin-dependent oxidoreductase (luciferase family)
LVNAHPGPTPTHPIGIWLGALRPRMLRLTGQKADGLLISAPYIPPENVPDIQQAVDKAAQEAGRDTRAIRRAYNLMGAIVQGNGPTITPTRKGVIVGTARQWVDELVRYYYDLRMDTFIFWPVMGDEETQARIFVEEVVPEVKAHIAG